MEAAESLNDWIRRWTDLIDFDVAVQSSAEFWAKMRQA
jgi:hypothetical protein